MHVRGKICERRAARTTSHFFLHDVLETTDSLVHVIINNPSMATACCGCYRELAVVVSLRCVRDAPDADASRTRQPLVTAVCYQRNQVELVSSYDSVPPAHCTRDPPTPTLVWAAKAWPSPFQNTLIKTPTTWATLSMTSSMRNITAVNWRYLCRPTQNSPRGRGRDPRTNEETKKNKSACTGDLGAGKRAIVAPVFSVGATRQFECLTPASCMSKEVFTFQPMAYPFLTEYNEGALFSSGVGEINACPPLYARTPAICR